MTEITKVESLLQEVIALVQAEPFILSISDLQGIKEVSARVSKKAQKYGYTIAREQEAKRKWYAKWCEDRGYRELYEIPGAIADRHMAFRSRFLPVKAHNLTTGEVRTFLYGETSFALVPEGCNFVDADPVFSDAYPDTKALEAV